MAEPSTVTRTESTPGPVAGLRHALALTVTGLAACALLVLGGCLVSMAGSSNVWLALVTAFALVVAGGAGVAHLMSRGPKAPSRG